MFIDSIKDRPIAWGIGVVAAALVAYGIADYIKKRKNDVPEKKEEVKPAPAQAEPAPRGKLPWAVGDIDMWSQDAEDMMV